MANIDGVTVGVGLSDLKGQLLLEHYEDLDPECLGEANFARLEELFEWFLTQNGGKLWAIGLGVPGAVEAAAGLTAAQRLGIPKVGTMPPWNDVLPFRKLMHRFKVPMWVRSAIQMEAMGEVTTLDGDSRREMLFVDLGTEIGLGLVLDGRIHLGVQGAAGQLGHIYIGEGHDKICGCGNVGCLQTVAGCTAVAFEGLRAARDGRSRPLREVFERTGTVTVSDIGNVPVGGPIRVRSPCAVWEVDRRCAGLCRQSAEPLYRGDWRRTRADRGHLPGSIREGIYHHAQPLVTGRYPSSVPVWGVRRTSWSGDSCRQ